MESVLESSSAPLEGWLPVERDEAGGVQLAGGGGPALYRTAEWAALPPCPGPAVIAPALIPAPPLVRPELDEAARVELLLTAYGQVCRRRLPTVWNPYGRGAESLKPKERSQLVAAAAVLQAHEVSPRRWVEFAWDQWTHGAAEDGSKRGKRERSPRPPLKVLFSPARIEEQAGWCRRERERRGGQLVLTRTHRHLLDRWQAMTRAVMRRELSPAEAVAKHLPPETWARLVAKATAEAKETQAKISSDILSGADLW